MALRNLTKVPKLCLVYFAVDKSTCVIETKKMRSKETGKLFSETAPNARDVVTVKSGGKLLEAMVIATGGKYRRLFRSFSRSLITHLTDVSLHFKFLLYM